MVFYLDKSSHEFDKNYVFKIPPNFNFTYDIIDEWSRWEDKLAIIFKDNKNHLSQCVRYNELADGAFFFSEVENDIGFQKGDIIYVIGEVNYHWTCIVIELIRRGIVFCPISSAITQGAIINGVNLINPKSILLTEDVDFNYDLIMQKCPTIKNIYKLDHREKIIRLKRQSNFQINENIRPYIPRNTMMIEFYLNKKNSLKYEVRDNTSLLGKSILTDTDYKSPSAIMLEDGNYKSVNWKCMFYKFIIGALVNIKLR